MVLGMKKRLISWGVDALLVAVMLLWVVGVDYMPVMQVLGFPLFLLAFALWVNWSNTFRELRIG